MAKTVCGVLVMAYGTPNRKEDILPYYTHIRRGRPPAAEQLAELTARYESIGGRSNLNAITAAQATAIGTVLNDGTDPDCTYRIYVGSKHWHPFIADVVKQMHADGIRQAVAIAMAPQGSKMSSGAYMEQVEQANSQLQEPIRFAKVISWHLEPDFIQALVQQVKEALAKFPGIPRAELPVLFTAHSLPERILTWEDTYPRHLREIGQAVAEAVGLKKISFGYQSAGRTPEPWLGPDVGEVITRLQQEGERAVLVCAVGFVSEHLEVLYDLDVEVRQLAEKLGIHFERMQMLNDHPLLAKAMAKVVRHAAHSAAE